MYIPMQVNELTPYERKCGHCPGVMKVIGMVCPKCNLTIHEECLEKCWKNAVPL